MLVWTRSSGTISIPSNFSNSFSYQFPSIFHIDKGKQTSRLVANSSEGHVYAGPLSDGYWVDAADLVAGDRLLNDDGSWAEVVEARRVEEPLPADNLTVEGYHTYFVTVHEYPFVW